MRYSKAVALVLLLAGGTVVRAQSDTSRRQADSASAGQAPARANVEREREHPDAVSLSDALDRLRGHPLLPSLPAARSVNRGNLTIEAGRTLEGPVATFQGTLTIHGRINGDAIAIAGDVVIASRGEVTGDAIAVEGVVRREGGVLGGESRALSGILVAGAAEPGQARAPLSAKSQIGLALSWLAVLLVIGIGVLVFAQPYLEGVVETLETRFWRSFLVGIAGELAAIPVLILMLVALAITIIGILLIPFAVVAYVLALAGFLTLGFVAVARLTGGAVGSDAVRRLSARGSALRGVVIGTVLLLGMWVAAAALASVPVLGALLRVVAATITFVALTAGLGATILSRAGTRGPVEATAAKPADAAVWQTPTPVTGVAAARRPAPRSREPV